MEDRTYERLIATARAEHILSRELIHININRLRSHVLRHRDDKEVYRFLRLAIEGDGFVQCKWFGRKSRTARIFPKRGELPFTNVSHPAILESLTSRYDGGKIVCIDYSNHEYRIFRGLFDITFGPDDIHTWASEKLSLKRDVCKALNAAMLYGNDDDFKVRARELYSAGYTCEEYLKMILKLRGIMKEFVLDNVDGFNSDGFIINSYGRKIYPKNENSIFNNVIQSVGSEILIDAINNLSELSKGRKWNMIFQRFDSIYFDFEPVAFKTDLNDVHKTMIGVNQKINLDAKIQVGDNVGNLKDLE